MSTANPPVTPIALTKTAALSRIIDAVNSGYIHYCTGQSPAQKLRQLACKFHALYGIGCSPAQRLTRKQKGQANTLFVAYCDAQTFRQSNSLPLGQPAEGVADHQTGIKRDDEIAAIEEVEIIEMNWDQLPAESRVTWALLASDGEGPVHEREALQCVTGKRRLHFAGYELLRHPVNGRTAWTFKRGQAEMDELYAVLDSQLKRHRHDQVAQTLLRISHQPGFHGVRKQSQHLLDYAVRCGFKGALPRLFYVQKVKHGISLRLD